MKKYLYYLIIAITFLSCSGLAHITQEQRNKIFIEEQPLNKDKAFNAVIESVSYTHLTLPTKA